jgi:hypothetical protein
MLKKSIAAVIDDHMIAGLTTKKFNHRELRLSENNSCQRRRVLRCLGFAETHPLTLDAARNFEKGRAGEMYAETVLDKAFPGQIRREVIVPHPFGDPHGEGHIDIEIKDVGLVEIKTVSEEKANSGLPVEDHIFQMQSYLHFYNRPGIGRYASGEILYLVLERYGIRPISFPVRYDPARGAAIEALMADTWYNYVLAEKLPNVPKEYGAKGFPCYWEMKNSNGQCSPQYCQYHGHCWDEASFIDNIPAIVNEAEMAQLFEKYWDLTQKYKSLNEDAEAAKAEKKEIESSLSSIFDNLGEKRISADGITISRAVVAGRTSYDINSAILCGVVDMRTLEPFAKQSNGHERYTIKI